MKTIKLIFSILTLFFAITVLGCKDIALPENKPENLPQQEYYTINLNKQYSLRSAMPDINLDNYYCIATLQSAEGSSIQTLASNSGTNINTITTKKLADSNILRNRHRTTGYKKFLFYRNKQQFYKR